MLYKYLNQWCLENKNQKLNFKSLLKKQDQYFLIFKNSKNMLQINLSSRDQYPFFTNNISLHPEDFNDLAFLSTHLAHALLTQITIDTNDRILFLHFEKFNIYNQIEKYQLILELIGKYQNIILIRLQDDKKIIIDCLRKISFSENRCRQILPGLVYEKPDTDYKPQDLQLISPLFINQEGKITLSETGQPYSQMNDLFQSLFYQYDLQKDLDSLKNQIIKKIKSELQKKEDKIGKLKSELNSESDAELLKKTGDLLLSSYHLAKPGMEEISLPDYFQNPPENVVVKLDKKLSWQQNIDRYFKKYRKAISGVEKIQEQIDLAQKEIIQLQSKIDFVNELNDFSELKERVKFASDSDKFKQEKHFRRLQVNNEWEIWIGRSSTENDLLTCKSSQPNDWWFHTRIFQGTHVVLRNFKKQDPPEFLIILCCRLAAYYSRAKNSTNVPVDYTQIRFIRKPRGSAPGFVTYKNQKTLYSDPVSIREAALILNPKEEKV